MLPCRMMECVSTTCGCFEISSSNFKLLSRHIYNRGWFYQFVPLNERWCSGKMFLSAMLTCTGSLACSGGCSSELLFAGLTDCGLFWVDGSSSLVSAGTSPVLRLYVSGRNRIGSAWLSDYTRRVPPLVSVLDGSGHISLGSVKRYGYQARSMNHPPLNHSEDTVGFLAF